MFYPLRLYAINLFLPTPNPSREGIFEEEPTPDPPHFVRGRLSGEGNFEEEPTPNPSKEGILFIQQFSHFQIFKFFHPLPLPFFILFLILLSLPIFFQ